MEKERTKEKGKTNHMHLQAKYQKKDKGADRNTNQEGAHNQPGQLVTKKSNPSR